MRPQTLAVSATPGPWEINEAGGVFTEQVIRPTGLIDPPVDIRPARTQVDDLVGEVRQVAQAGYRALVTAYELQEDDAQADETDDESDGLGVGR